MKRRSNMKILVLAGGLSNERNVSLASGAMAAQALRQRGHQVGLVDVFSGEEDGINFEKLSTRALPEKWFTVGSNAPDLQSICNARPYESRALIGRNVIEICKEVDVVFLALHGGTGEDGRLQATLDMFGIPYTGSDYLASGLAMNKDLTKILVSEAGVKTPGWQRLFVRDQKHIDELVKTVSVPCVVKIPTLGSSVGVYISKTKDELRAALEATVGHRVIIEQFIQGREIQMAFFREAPLPSIEIVPLDAFYTYASKYVKGAAIETTPADITPEQEKKMGKALMKVAKALNLYTFSRADFIIDEAGEIWFIEVNTLPGVTPTSLFPQEAAAAGIGFGELCEMIALDGIERSAGLGRALF